MKAEVRPSCHAVVSIGAHSIAAQQNNKRTGCVPGCFTFDGYQDYRARFRPLQLNDPRSADEV